MECARNEFELSVREGDGAPLRTHLQRLAVNTGKVDPRLLVECPAAGTFIWNAFKTMTRTYTMGGPGPISMVEIEAWQRVNGMRLTTWELDMIHAFDSVALEMSQKKAKS